MKKDKLLAELKKAFDIAGPTPEEEAAREAELKKFQDERRAEHERRLAAVKLISREGYNRRRRDLARRIKDNGILMMDAMGWDGRDMDFSSALAPGKAKAAPTREEILSLEGLEQIVDIIEKHNKEFPADKIAKEILAAERKVLGSKTR